MQAKQVPTNNGLESIKYGDFLRTKTLFVKEVLYSYRQLTDFIKQFSTRVCLEVQDNRRDSVSSHSAAILLILLGFAGITGVAARDASQLITGNFPVALPIIGG